MILLMSLVLFYQSAQAKDITRKIIEHTTIDDEIAETCRRYCQGNKSKATLRQVLLSPLKESQYKVTAVADFNNHHYIETMPGNGFSVFRYTVSIVVKGVLDSKTCRFKLDDVDVINDKLGLADLVKAEKNKTYRIKECQRFL